MMIGVPYAPISVPYSLMSSDFGKLKSIIEILTPGMVFVSDGKPFARAIDAAVPIGVEIVVTANPLGSRPSTQFADLVISEPTDAVDAAHAKVGPDTIAKILFTSGSTGNPKGVINTQGMLCANQAQIRAGLAFVGDEPPVIVDWLPWNHTFGSNHNFNLVLDNGGSLYIDEGKPLPGAIAATAKNLQGDRADDLFQCAEGLRDAAAVPARRRRLAEKLLQPPQGAVLCRRGLAAIRLGRVAGDERRHLRRARHLHLQHRLDRNLAAGDRLQLGFPRPGNIGVPAPRRRAQARAERRQARSRLKGPNITPGYWRRPDLTKEAFDEEGYYKIGDALKFVDAADPSQGLLFDGRLAEDFKLLSGTWVSAGALRAQFVDHCAPLVRDAVIAGVDRDDIAALVFPDVEACRKLAGLAADAAARRGAGRSEIAR